MGRAECCALPRYRARRLLGYGLVRSHSCAMRWMARRPRSEPSKHRAQLASEMRGIRLVAMHAYGVGFDIDLGPVQRTHLALRSMRSTCANDVFTSSMSAGLAAWSERAVGLIRAVGKHFVGNRQIVGSSGSNQFDCPPIHTQNRVGSKSRTARAIASASAASLAAMLYSAPCGLTCVSVHLKRAKAGERADLIQDHVVGLGRRHWHRPAPETLQIEVAKDARRLPHRALTRR